MLRVEGLEKLEKKKKQATSLRRKPREKKKGKKRKGKEGKKSFNVVIQRFFLVSLISLCYFSSSVKVSYCVTL